MYFHVFLRSFTQNKVFNPSDMKKVAMITGATSGIGEATARLFASTGDYDLIVTGRRAERLRELKKELKNAYGTKIHVMCFDVRDYRRGLAALDSMPEEYRHIDILVNNAGRATDLVKFQEGDVRNWDEVIDINIKGFIYMARIISERMAKQGGGHIVNLGSIAGTEAYENGNVYCATKHAVHALSRGMRIDLLGTGVKVTEIRPGKVETEFSIIRFHGDKEKADKVYEGIRPLKGEDIAQIILWAVTQPAHVNVDEVVVTPISQANSYYNKKEM